MNKTLSIGLAGFSFVIEEHAYIKLNDYLAALKRTLEADEADEVMHDIEIRMVEIFKDSLGKREVINDSDVEKVIAQIGTPEQIDEQEEAYFSDSEKKSTRQSQSTSFRKQLFRIPENGKLGGVCAGLANYFGIGIGLMRAIWVGVGLLGIFSAHISTLFWVLGYIILWIALPEAKTASDFLKMKGEPMNFDNLKKESNKIVHFTNESAQKVGEVYQQNKGAINTVGNGIWDVFRFILGGILGLIGLGFLFSAIAIIGFGFDSDVLSMPGKFRFFLEDDWTLYLGMTFAFFTVFIPSVIFIFVSIKLLSPKTKLNYTGYIIGALVFVWFVLLVLIGVKAAKYKAFYKGTNEETENIAINSTSDSILVDLKKVQIPASFKAYGDDIYSDKKMVYEEDYPRLSVTKKVGDFSPYLIVTKSGSGYNQGLKMEVPVEIVANKILLPNYFKYPYQNRLRDYEVEYELVVPKNKKVIALNGENGFSIDEDDDQDDDQSQNSSSKKDQTISIVAADDSDSIIVNGKSYQKDKADSILKKAIPKNLKDIEKLKDVDIKIKDGKSEISIKTK